MKCHIAAGVVVAVTISVVRAQSCAAGSAKEIGGNWYCDAVNAITYSDFGSSGSYNKITSMNGGKCESEPFAYSGPLAPLDGEISWHFRGPLNLKQFAHYAPGSKSGKKDTKVTPHRRRRHGHGHGHSHRRFEEVHEIQESHMVEEKRAMGDTVTATIDGKVVSWTNQYGAGTQPTTPSAAAPARHAHQSTNLGAPKPATGPTKAGTGQWGRQAYYNAEQQTADGLTFLNNMGGQGSGVFDELLGMSLSYAAADAKSGVASPQILANQMLDDGDEIVIMTDKICKDGDCGMTRPGGVAYHGFDGTKKVFLLEFDMPITGATGWNKDMPSAWILNAQIPNTAQYGKPECSCWESGCGEWDIFEVLDSGNTRCKSTIHGNISGGDSNYFARPVDSTIKVAVIFDGENGAGHIVVLPAETTFDQMLTDAQVAGYVNQDSPKIAKSLFRLGS